MRELLRRYVISFIFLNFLGLINHQFQILTGHEKGVLSLSWCKQDPDLLLSCGKDNRALCWNPQTSEIIGEVCDADVV